MKVKILILVFLLFGTSAAIFGQNPAGTNQNAIEDIVKQLASITKSVDELNKRLKMFSETFSSNQGIRLSEKQQKLLLAFEFLNRAEQRLLSLQNLKLSLTEKQTAFRLQLARINDDLLPESIDRYVSTRGTTNAELLRDLRRQALLKEKFDLTTAVSEIQIELNQTNEEIRQTSLFLRTLRGRIFPEIEKELSEF